MKGEWVDSAPCSGRTWKTSIALEDGDCKAWRGDVALTIAFGTSRGVYIGKEDSKNQWMEPFSANISMPLDEAYKQDTHSQP